MSEFLNRLYKRIHKSESGCWEYLAYMNPNGYCQIWYHGKRTYAHRAALIEKTGVNKKGMEACHTCDNRKCINPEHLWWGTKSENLKDMSKKGRSKQTQNPEMMRGENHPYCKYQAKDIVRIRKLVAMGVPNKQIAEKFKMHQSYVSAIKYRKVWNYDGI